MRAILQASPDAPIAALIVWLPMLPEDDAAAAAEAARLCDDPRAQHFHDPEKLAGQVVATRLGGAGRVAWDVYLVYAPEARWDRDLPLPATWTHQLGDSGWADAAHYRTGEALVATLTAAVRQASSRSQFRADRDSVRGA